MYMEMDQHLLQISFGDEPPFTKLQLFLRENQATIGHQGKLTSFCVETSEMFGEICRLELELSFSHVLLISASATLWQTNMAGKNHHV